MPADHAFKTMTMEAFPHSGTQLASVHPCKHASVMKKFIDRMEESSAAAAAGPDGALPHASAGNGKDKRRWLPGVMRKVTGGEKKAGAGAGASGANTPGADEEQGLQVDFYLVIVSRVGRRASGGGPSGARRRLRPHRASRACPCLPAVHLHLHLYLQPACA